MELRGKLAWRPNANTLWATILTVVLWPITKADLVPMAGLDESWAGSLSNGAVSGIHFGTQLVFTYGPLGFLNVPALYHPSTAILAFGYEIVIRFSIFYCIIRLLRRVVPISFAVPIAFLVGGPVILTGGGPEDSYALLIVVVAAIVSRPPGNAAPAAWWVTVGAALGFFPLLKVSLAVGMVTLAAMAIVGTSERKLRPLALVAVPAVLVSSGAWFATGNGIGNVIAYVKTSAQVAEGYTAAMSISVIGSKMWLLQVLAFLAAVLSIVMSTWYSKGLPARARLALAASTIVVFWLLAKESFVRLDLGHAQNLFSCVPLILCGFLRKGSRSRHLGESAAGKWAALPLRYAGVAGIGLSVVMAYLLVGGIPRVAYEPTSGLSQFAGVARTLVSSSSRDAIMDSARTEMRATYQIPKQMVRALDGHTFDTDPWEKNVAWAYPDFRSDQLSVLQDYSAYTPSLDATDVSMLDSKAAPEYILKQTSTYTLDGRAESFDPPATQLAITCHYREVETSRNWDLLKRIPNRCSEPEPIKVEVSPEGVMMSVPSAPAGYAIVASFQVPTSLAWKLEDIFFKPPTMCFYADVNGGSHLQAYRFIEATAGDLHMIRPSSNLGYSPQIAPMSVDSLSVSECEKPSLSVDMRTQFYLMKVSPAR